MAKRVLIVILSIVVCFSAAISLAACKKGAISVSKGLEFTADGENKTYTMSGIGQCKDKDVVIPATYDGKPVTAIGKDAFRNSSIKSVTIPGSVTAIGAGAFEYCREIENLIIPDSVKKIGKFAFYGCDSLKSITLPFVGEAFDGTENTHFGFVFGAGNYLETTSVGKIPESLQSVTISDGSGVTEICERAFYGAHSLKNISLPNSLMIVGEGAFDGIEAEFNAYGNGLYLGNANNPYVCFVKTAAESVTDLAFNESCKTICENSLNGCDALKFNEYENGLYLGSASNPYMCLVKAKSKSEAVCAVNLDCKFIYGEAFADCEKITAVTVPEGVISIGKKAFYNCDSVSGVTIPDSVKYIGDGAFQGCESLTAISVGENNKRYKSMKGDLYAANGAVLLQYSVGKKDKKFTVPNGLKRIESGAFFGVSASITEIYYNGNVNEWAQLDGVRELTARNAVDKNLYVNGELLTEAVFDAADKINEAAFYTCKPLTRVVIGGNVKSIGEKAFSHCRNLETVTIDNGLTEIGSEAFSYCAMTSVTVPESVRHLGRGAFKQCRKLTQAKIEGEKSSLGTWMHGETFSGCDSLKNVVLGDGVKNVSNKTFERCGSLKTITLPDSVLYIETQAFTGCGSLIDVTIGKNVTDIGSWAFENCMKLTQVKFDGPKEYWAQISKLSWNKHSNIETVICSDGTVYL